MAIPKLNTKDIILLAIAAIFVIATLALSGQNGTLKSQISKLQTEADDLLKVQNGLKQQLTEANEKLAEQTSLAASLQEQLTQANTTIQTLNIDKEALLGEIKTIKGEQQASQTDEVMPEPAAAEMPPAQ